MIPSIVIAVNKGMIEFTMIINLFQVLDLLTQNKGFGVGGGILLGLIYDKTKP